MTHPVLTGIDLKHFIDNILILLITPYCVVQSKITLYAKQGSIC